MSLSRGLLVPPRRPSVSCRPREAPRCAGRPSKPSRSLRPRAVPRCAVPTRLLLLAWRSVVALGAERGDLVPSSRSGRAEAGRAEAERGEAERRASLPEDRVPPCVRPCRVPPVLPEPPGWSRLAAAVRAARSRPAGAARLVRDAVPVLDVLSVPAAGSGRLTRSLSPALAERLPWDRAALVRPRGDLPSDCPARAFEVLSAAQPRGVLDERASLRLRASLALPALPPLAARSSSGPALPVTSTPTYQNPSARGARVFPLTTALCRRPCPRLLPASPAIILTTDTPHHKNAEGHHLAVTALSGKMSGGVLLSHAVSHAVPSALKGLTSGFGMGPGVSPSLWPPKRYGDVTPSAEPWDQSPGSPRPTAPREPHSGRKQDLEVEAKPLGLLVPVSSTRCRASTSGLSTQSSSWGPYQVNPEGDLILRRASRLDAFSGYPFQT